MFKPFFAMGLMCCFAFKVSASPENDARYMASQRFLEEEIHAMRANAARYYVEYLGGLLSRYNVRIKDPKRLESLVPQEITDVAIDVQLKEFADSYLEVYDAQQLSEIRTFYLTGVWQKLKRLSYDECKSGAVKKTVIAPQVRGYEVLKIQQFLTPQEFRDFRDFFDSETGRVFGAGFEHEVICSDELNTTGVFSLRLGEATIRTEFVLNALKTKGIFRFSNPVARKDFIAKIESEIQ